MIKYVYLIATSFFLASIYASSSSAEFWDQGKPWRDSFEEECRGGDGYDPKKEDAIGHPGVLNGDCYKVLGVGTEKACYKIYFKRWENTANMYYHNLGKMVDGISPERNNGRCDPNFICDSHAGGKKLPQYESVKDWINATTGEGTSKDLMELMVDVDPYIDANGHPQCLLVI